MKAIRVAVISLAVVAGACSSSPQPPDKSVVGSGSGGSGPGGGSGGGATGSSSGGSNGGAAGSSNGGSAGGATGSSSGGSNGGAPASPNGGSSGGAAGSSGGAGAGGRGGGGGNESSIRDGGNKADVGETPEAGRDSSHPAGNGMYSLTFDASMPNHFGCPEHLGKTIYGTLVDTTNGAKIRVEPIYSTLMTAGCYCKWVWHDALVPGHTYTLGLFADSAMQDATCVPGGADAGWLFSVPAVKGDVVYTFPTGNAPRADQTKCSVFPMGALTGAISVPAP
jgi:hypothetical protein